MNRFHRIILNTSLIICMSSFIYGQESPSFSYRIPPYYIEQYETRRGCNNDSDCASSLIGAILLGCASGFLCRQFEKIVLNDTIPLRLLNIIIWGHFESRLMDNITLDLKNQRIKHSPHMIKRIAWLSSWISYLLGTLPS